MREVDILAYASHVVGFPIACDTPVIVNEDCTGRDRDNLTVTSEKGAHGFVRAIRMLPQPWQLSIQVEIFVSEGRSFECSFTEADGDMPFPLAAVKAAEDTPPAETEGKSEQPVGSPS